MSETMMRTGSRIEILRRMRSDVVRRASALEQQIERTRTKYAGLMDELEIIDRLLQEEKKCGFR